MSTLRLGLMEEYLVGEVALIGYVPFQKAILRLGSPDDHSHSQAMRGMWSVWGMLSDY
jgi:hypothetical protein